MKTKAGKSADAVLTMEYYFLFTKGTVCPVRSVFRGYDTAQSEVGKSPCLEKQSSTMVFVVYN